MANWRQNPVVAIVAVAVLVLGVGLLTLVFKTPKQEFLLKCDSCKAEFQAKLPADVTFPVKCPLCGQTQAYQGVKVKCKACGKELVRINKPLSVGSGEIDVKQRTLGPDPRSQCPYCGVRGQVDESK